LLLQDRRVQMTGSPNIRRLPRYLCRRSPGLLPAGAHQRGNPAGVTSALLAHEPQHVLEIAAIT
jgi:hypothetical protein